MERRYLVVPGTHSSRIHILDTQPDPRNPRLVKVIEGDEVMRKTGYAAPHTVHCGPDGIYINALGTLDGGGPGGIFMLDNETFEILRAVSFVPRYKALCDQHPDKVGPNIKANVEEGLRYSLEDVGWAHVEQTKIYREFVRMFQEIDLLIPSGGVMIHRVPTIHGSAFARVLSFARNCRRVMDAAGCDLVLSNERTLRQDVCRAGGGCHREWLLQLRRYHPGLARSLAGLNPLHLTLLWIEKRSFSPENTRAIIANSHAGRRRSSGTTGFRRSESTSSRMERKTFSCKSVRIGAAPG